MPASLFSDSKSSTYSNKPGQTHLCLNFVENIAAAFYKSRSKYGGMDASLASLMTRLKELEAESRKLKKKGLS